MRYVIPRTSFMLLLAVGVQASTAAAERKELHVTVDYNTYVMRASGALKPENVEAIITRFSELGINRLYWMHHAEDYIAGVPLTDPKVDLIEFVVKAAHARGMKVWFLFKPFETGSTAGFTFPPGTQAPADLGTLQSITGTHAMITSFVAKHPQYRLKRRDPGRWQDRQITTVKLVKSDNRPTLLRKEHIEIYASEVNGNWKKLATDFQFGDSVEERHSRKVRVLTFGGLDISPENRYVLVRADTGREKSDFANTSNRLIELYDAAGERIPFTWDEGSLDHNSVHRMLETFFHLRQGRALSDPSRWIPDSYGRSLTDGGFRFEQGNSIPNRTFGYIAVAKGKNAYLPGGALHPVYPEVRRYWIDEIIQRGVLAGVDGVDIRIANHSTYTCEGAEYGFNDPVVKEYRKRHGVDILSEPYDSRKLRQLNGEYFTLFLRELRTELNKRNLPLQVHVAGPLRESHFRNKFRNSPPISFEFAWRTWIADSIVDSIALKYLPWPVGAGGEADPRADDAFRNEVVDFADKHGTPVYDNVRLYIGRVPTSSLRDRVRQIQADPRVAGAILYEGYKFVSADVPTGTAKLNPVIRKIIAPLRPRADANPKR